MRRLTRTVAAAAMATALALVGGCSSDSEKSESGGGNGAALEKVTYLTSFGNFGRDSYAWVAKDKASSRRPVSTSTSSPVRAPAP